jgi:hypothetical protein
LKAHKYGVELDSTNEQPLFHASGSFGSFEGFESAGEQSAHTDIVTADDVVQEKPHSSYDVCLELYLLVSTVSMTSPIKGLQTSHYCKNQFPDWNSFHLTAVIIKKYPR